MYKINLTFAILFLREASADGGSVATLMICAMKSSCVSSSSLLWSKKRGRRLTLFETMEAASELASSSSEETTFEELRNESISLDSSTDGLPEDGEAGLLCTGEGLGASGVSENVRTRKNHSSLLLVAGEMGMSTISGAFFTFL